jgi:hypothetical protein
MCPANVPSSPSTPLKNAFSLLKADADDALQAGDYLSAIRILTEANRLLPSRNVERSLINLRIDAFEHSRPGACSWSSDFDSRFDSAAQGLPEISLAELSAGNLRAGILGSGGLIVRGLMGEDQVVETRENIERSLRVRKDFAEGVAAADENAWYSRPSSVAGGPVQFSSLGSNKYTETGSVWAVDSPPSAYRLIEFYQQIGLPRILEEYFGEPACLSVKKWVLRCVAPNNGGEAGWHQDGQFMGDDIRTVNLWIALSDCGGGASAPGIDIVPGNQREIHETGTQGAAFDWTVGQGIVDSLAKRDPIQRPRFSPGDAIFFDHYNLHRTAFGTEDRNNRYAVESWFFAGSKAPVKQQPLLF